MENKHKENMEGFGSVSTQVPMRSPRAVTASISLHSLEEEGHRSWGQAASVQILLSVPRHVTLSKFLHLGVALIFCLIIGVIIVTTYV